MPRPEYEYIARGRCSIGSLIKRCSIGSLIKRFSIGRPIKRCSEQISEPET